MHLLSSLSDLMTVSVAHAQLALPGVVDTVAAPNTLITFICNVVFTWIFTAAIILSILCVLYAAFNYMTGAGDPGKITLANKTIVFAAIGIAVAILARTLPIAVGSIVQNGLKLDPCVASTTPRAPGT